MRIHLNVFLIALSLLFFHQTYAQEKFTVSGTITNNEAGEALIGANVNVPALKTGTNTNNYGFYSLTIPRTDSLEIVFSHIGYAVQAKKIHLNQNIELDIKLKISTGSLDEVAITGQQLDENVTKPRMGVVDIPIKNIQTLPVILGESDVLKMVQLQPGVQTGNEGTVGYFVRGGNADQNLIQLDEAIVYNPNHIFGLFSTFNSRALNNVTLIKGGFPAQYGGRLSSILDITMKEGNNRKFHGDGGIGLVTSQLTLEGPIKKEEASFIVSGRRTYIDLIAKPFLAPGSKSNYHFYDLNAKVNWKLTPKDRLFLSFFNGRDNAEYNEAQGINYKILFGNSTATLRWNHLFGQKLFANSSLIYNEYEQDIRAIQDNFFSQVFSGINDVSGKTEFQYFPNPKHIVLFGAHYTCHKFLSSGKSEAQSGGTAGSNINLGKVPVKYINEFALYVNDEFTISDKFSTSLGVRVPAFIANDVSYYRLEPLATIRYSINNTSSIKAAYTLMNQFLHLIPSSTTSVTTDIWIPSTPRTRPQISEQYAIGYFRNFRKNQLETSMEIYYKTMDNQVLFREGNQLIESLDVDSYLVYGSGISYGVEFLVKKNTGRFTGWLSYTLSKTDQKFDSLNFGNTFPFTYDRRHVLSLVGAYKINDRWTLSGVFSYSTGSVYTLPEGRITVFHGGTLFEGNYFVYENRNNTRLNAYHRLDISASYKKRGPFLRRNMNLSGYLDFITYTVVKIPTSFTLKWTPKPMSPGPLRYLFCRSYPA